jgi:hypothetical protein
MVAKSLIRDAIYNVRWEAGSDLVGHSSKSPDIDLLAVTGVITEKFRGHPMGCSNDSRSLV